MMQCKYQAKQHSDWPAIRLTLFGIATLVISVLAVLKFEAELRRINWAIVIGIDGVAFGFYVMYRWARAKNTIEPWDAILDPVTRRLSLWRVSFVIMLALGVWIIVQWVISGDVPANAGSILTLYGTIVTGLLAKVASGEWADVKGNRQPVVAQEPPKEA